jgi:ubiquitin thioesterase OTU1
MRVRLRSPKGQHVVELPANATYGDLKAAVFDKTGIAPGAVELKTGFPPAKIDGEDAAVAAVSDGESITVAETASVIPAVAPAHAVSHPAPSMDEDEALARAIAASLADAAPESGPPLKAARTDAGPIGGTSGVSGLIAQRRVIDSDNSCLFNAVGYVMKRSLREAPALRRVIADVVAADEFEYNEGFLGKPNAKYCEWILDKNHWGGAVELSILAKHFGREIAAYDIQTKRCDVYGQGENYSERAMVLYDGLHYDAMVLTRPGASKDEDVTVFPSTGPEAEEVDAKARAVVDEAHRARAFTDVANFTLRCLVCQKGLVGEKDAVAHAKSTGHQNFSEY